jgi:hypothetical protein
MPKPATDHQRAGRIMGKWNLPQLKSDQLTGPKTIPILDRFCVANVCEVSSIKYQEGEMWTGTLRTERLRMDYSRFPIFPSIIFLSNNLRFIAGGDGCKEGMPAGMPALPGWAMPTYVGLQRGMPESLGVRGDCRLTSEVYKKDCLRPSG